MHVALLLTKIHKTYIFYQWRQTINEIKKLVYFIRRAMKQKIVVNRKIGLRTLTNLGYRLYL